MVTPAERPRIQAMWVVHLMLTLAALYAVIIAGMYFAQTRFLFPTMFAGSARVQLPASTQRLQIRTPNGESPRLLDSRSLERPPSKKRLAFSRKESMCVDVRGR